MGIKRICLKIAKSRCGWIIGKSLKRVSSYIERVNSLDFRISMQERVSPVNWVKNHTSDAITAYKFVLNDSNSSDSLIKVRVYHQQANMWNSVETLCGSLMADNRVDFLSVLTGTSHDMASLISQMERMKIPYVEYSKYSLEKDKPDIVIIYHNGAWSVIPNNLKNTRTYAAYIAEIPLSIINPFHSTESYIWNLHQDEINADVVILDKYTYKLSSENDTKHNNYHLMGNPKFDGIYNIMHENKTMLPCEWAKLNNKKVVLITTDHGLSTTSVYQDVAFDLYASAIFTYFSEHKDIGLIFRPHTTYINELLKTFWSFSDYDFFLDLFKNSENMVWDQTDNYAYAYSISDAVISDINCDVIGSSLVIDKPIAVLKRFDTKVISYNEEITNSYLNIDSEETLVAFLEMVRTGKIRVSDAQIKAKNKVVSNFDGLNGARIKDFLIGKYFEKYSSKRGSP